jgi:membrane-associated phospholipid phosphatase
MILFLAAAACFGQTEPQAGTWKTLVIRSGSEFRVAAPATGAEAAEEVAWLKTFVAGTTAATTAQVQYWDAGAPSYRWLQLGLNRLRRQGFGNPGNTRAIALLNAAMYDATIATWDSKYAHRRPAPSVADPTVRTLVAVNATPSYPSEHAATAAAAAAVLTYFYPAEAQQWAALAEEAGRSRLHAGANYPSDMIEGLALGRRVGARVVERARADGADAVWSGTVPTGPGFWVGTNPVTPLHGNWQPWVLTSGAQFRPAPPPAFNSNLMREELAEVKGFTRTFDTNAGAFYWHTFDGVVGYWYDLANQLIFENGVDRNAPRAARVYALAGITQADASISCWEAKYEFWSMRPVHLDPSVNPVFPTPNHPSYPAGHGCYSGGIAQTLATLFPADADFVNGKADEAALSRVAGGIHFRSDIVVGLDMGRKISALVMTKAAEDGSGGRRAQ